MLVGGGFCDASVGGAVRTTAETVRAALHCIGPLPGVKTVDVQLTWDPPWGMDMMSDEARLELGFM